MDAMNRLQRVSSAPGGRTALVARLPGRPGIPRVPLDAVHSTQLEAALHARAGRVPRTPRSRAAVLRPQLRTVLAADWTRFARRSRRLHRKACNSTSPLPVFGRKYAVNFST